MKTDKIIKIILLSILVIFFTSIIIIAIFNKENFFDVFDDNYTLTEEKIRKDSSFSSNNIEELSIDLNSSRIEIEFTDDASFRIVQYTKKIIKDKYLYVVSENNNSLKINEQEHINFFCFGPSRSVYKIYIPRTYKGSLDIKTASSNLYFSEDLKFKELKLNITSGNIKLIGALETEYLNIKTVSGRINLNELKAINTNINTTSGSITVNNITSAYNNISSVSGDIKVGDINGEKMDVKTTSGHIDINDIIGLIEAKTVSGNIFINSIIGGVNAKTTSGSVKIQNFHIGMESNIKTVSGLVKVNLDSKSNCEVKTNTVSGSVDYPNDSSVFGFPPYDSLNIKTTSGNIKIESQTF